MDWILEPPMLLWLLAAVFFGFLSWFLWPRKKSDPQAAEEPEDSGDRKPKALDPLDNSPLKADAVDIPVETESGKIALIRVNRRNARILRTTGWRAFPGFRENIQTYGRRHRDHYRRYFAPEYYYVIGGDDGFDPIMWWVYFDLLFGHSYEDPAYHYDPSLWPDMDREYRDKSFESLDQLPEASDAAQIAAYLSTFPDQDHAVASQELRERLGLGSQPAPSEDRPQEEPLQESGRAAQEKDPADLSAFLSQETPSPAAFREEQAPTHEATFERAEAPEVHETEAAPEPTEVDTSPSE